MEIDYSRVFPVAAELSLSTRPPTGNEHPSYGQQERYSSADVCQDGKWLTLRILAMKLYVESTHFILVVATGRRLECCERDRIFCPQAEVLNVIRQEDGFRGPPSIMDRSTDDMLPIS